MATLLSNDEIRKIILDELATQPNGTLTGVVLVARILSTVRKTYKFPDIIDGKIVFDFIANLNELYTSPQDNFGLISEGLVEYNNSQGWWTITARGRSFADKKE